MRKKQNLPGLGEYLLRLSTELENEGRHGTSRTYVKTHNSFVAYLEGADIPINRIDHHVIDGYNRHLRERNLTRNAISFYNRVLRAAYNKAVREYRMPDTHPFGDVYTGVDRTASRAVGETLFARLMSLDLSGNADLSLTRDLFIFSYAMRGMSFVDMAYLKKAQIHDGYLIYNRRKTGVTLRIRIETEARKIIEKYRSSSWNRKSEYLFPILEEGNNSSGSYLNYCSGLSSYNRRLKRLAKLAGIDQKLTSHVARHSWATAARNAGNGMPLISEALGHSSERMTRIYLGEFDACLVDAMNRKLMSNIHKRASNMPMTPDSHEPVECGWRVG